mgnify:CR=1 FL=1
MKRLPAPGEYGRAQCPVPCVTTTTGSALPLLDLTDFKRDLSELTDRLGQAQDCL